MESEERVVEVREWRMKPEARKNGVWKLERERRDRREREWRMER